MGTQKNCLIDDWNGSFEQTKQYFKLIEKKMLTILHLKIMFILSYK